MFDGLFKPKFYSKCKSCAKVIKIRLEAIRKKRNAVQKFLKKDIADLLRSGLDYNAYGRAEGLLVEQNMSSCYELIAKFIGCISYHVRDLYKQKDCPDECKEAIPSLMYAAARFSDLPELRDLRTLFTEKYGNFLEPYISKEFVQKLRQDPPSKEMKIQLLRDLAKEFSIEWDSKALELRLYSPPHLHEEKPRHDTLNDYDDEKWHKGNNDVPIPKGNNASDDETSTEYSFQDVRKACSSSLESVSEDEVEMKRPFSHSHVLPPYVKETFNKGESNLKKTTESEAVPENVVQKKPIPRSVRSRRPLKPSPDHDTVSDSKITDNIAKLHSEGLESEKAMDDVLMHYSKKQSAYTKSGSGAAPAPVRGTSLPSEHYNTSMETLKGRGRTSSLVPEMLSAARHVHPSLPDYDDFAARLSALRGR